MTVNELALQLLGENSESTDDTNRVTIVETWISDAVAEIANLSEWKFFQKEYSFTTTIGDSTYQLPVEALDLKYLRIPSEDIDIQYIDPERLVATGFDLEDQARPEFWWYENADLTVDDAPLIIRMTPTPDAAYNLQAPYYFHPGELASSSVIPVPRDKVLVIKNRVRAQFFLYDKEYDSYDRMIQKFNEAVLAAVNSERKKHARTLTLQPRDIPSGASRRFARLDPSHFRNR